MEWNLFSMINTLRDYAQNCCNIMLSVFVISTIAKHFRSLEPLCEC